MPVYRKFSIILYLPMLGIALGCTGLRNPTNLNFVSWDYNTYFRPSFVYERISHDNSSHTSVNYFRWLHGPIPYELSPSEYTQINSSASLQPELTPTPAMRPPVQHPIPQRGPEFQPGPVPPHAPPVEIVVPPELAPYPERNANPPIPPSPFNNQSLPPQIQEGPTASRTQNRTQKQTIQPAGYPAHSRLPMTNVIFARP